MTNQFSPLQPLARFDAHAFFEIGDDNEFRAIGAAGAFPFEGYDDETNLICRHDMPCTNLSCPIVNTDCYNNKGCGSDKWCL